MKYDLCKECPDNKHCYIPCPESLEVIPVDPKDRYRDKEYVPKGVSMLSYTESRRVRDNNLKEIEAIKELT